MNDERERPRTVEEAAEMVLEDIGEEGRERLQEMERDDLIDLHFGLGQSIRNVFGLWQGNGALLEDCARVAARFVGPDDASGVILEAAWRKLRDSSER